MEYARLGSTDLYVSRVGFGCEPLGCTDWGDVDEGKVFRAIHKALDLGINFFDTADVYGLGRSEENLSKALGRRRHDVIIATKFGINWTTPSRGGRAKTFFDSTPKRVVEALEGSLRRLRIDCVSLYQIHWLDSDTGIANTMEALSRCQEAGKIRYAGCCNVSPGLIREAHSQHPLASVQAQYNVLERNIESEILPCCRQLGVGVVVWGPLAQGLLTGKYKRGARFGDNDRRSRLEKFKDTALQKHMKVVDNLRNIGFHYGKVASQVALRWILDNPMITCAITGAKDPDQVETNVGALGWNLSEADRGYLAM